MFVCFFPLLLLFVAVYLEFFFLTFSIRAGLPAGNIDRGLEVTRNISQQANDAVHLSLMENPNQAKLGKLVLQDVFLSQESHRQVYKERRVFLFEKALVITKRRVKEDSELYAIKDQLLVSGGCGYIVY